MARTSTLVPLTAAHCRTAHERERSPESSGESSSRYTPKTSSAIPYLPPAFFPSSSLITLSALLFVGSMEKAFL